MGVFWTIRIKCPACGERIETQSKAEDGYSWADLEEVTSVRILEDVIQDGPYRCSCGASIEVQYDNRPRARAVVTGRYDY